MSHLEFREQNYKFQGGSRKIIPLHCHKDLANTSGNRREKER